MYMRTSDSYRFEQYLLQLDEVPQEEKDAIAKGMAITYFWHKKLCNPPFAQYVLHLMAWFSF